MSGVFICYRRDDTDYIAGRLYRELADHFGKEQVFRDIDHIKAGADFAGKIDDFIGSCDALVAIIGDNWLQDDDGRRRMDNPKDWVRREITSALKLGILVVPVLVEDARLPREEDLPRSLHKLVTRNAVELTDKHWDHEVMKLIEALKEVVKPNVPVATQSPTIAAPRLQAPPLPLGPASAPPVTSPPHAPPTVTPGPVGTRPALGSAPSDSRPPAPAWSPDSGAPTRSEISLWAKMVIPVVLVVGGVLVLLVRVFAGDGEVDPVPPPGFTVTSQAATTLAPTAVTTAAPTAVTTAAPTAATTIRTIDGPWSGSNGRLTLTVERVELGQTIRLHMLVRNRVGEAVALPMFGYFNAVDNNGHNYAVGNAEWATQFPPGDTRGTIELSEPRRSGASQLKVGFGTVFGSLAVRGGIYVEGVRLA